MAENSTFLKLIDLVQAELPAIGRLVMESTSNALQGSAKHFPLLDPWNKRRARFQMEFESELRPALARMRQGEQPARAQFGGIEGLSLVDEHQALRDVGIAHVVELCLEHSRNELFQLGNFFTALKRGSTPGRDPNPLRPALFARALVNALAGADLSAEANYALVRAAAPGLAQALVPLYRQLAAALRADNLSALVSTRPGQERPRRRDARDSQPGALADWHARSQAVSSRPQTLIRSEPQAQGLLERLYERILADPALAPPVKAQLARLQVAVARLSRDDSSLLRREDHPAWRLINAIAAYAGGFANAQDPRLDNFLRFLEEQTQALVESPNPSGEQFETLLRLVDAFIARQARERSAPTQAALAALEREQQRAPWLKLLREQLATQIRPARLAREVKQFLLGPWADTVVQAMVVEGHEAPAVQQLVHLVDDLVESLKPRRDRADRERLRQSLPVLVGRLDGALGAASLSEARRKSLMLELMQLHSRVLSGQFSPEPPDTAAAKTPEEQPDEAEVSRFVEERDSAYASIWAYATVDRGALPTQPLPLHEGDPEQHSEVQQWLKQLRIGGWFHLFVDGNWDTAQLVWISGERHYFLFISQDSELRHSLTVGALTQLYLNGLVMYLDQEGLVERAVATLIHDL